MALASANAVIDGGKHPLHTGSNKVTTYGEIFYKVKGISEVIFSEEYNTALGKTHAWSGYALPDGFKAGMGFQYAYVCSF